MYTHIQTLILVRGDGSVAASRRKGSNKWVAREDKFLTNPNMVLLRRADAKSQAGLASLGFDGKQEPDVAKFFIVYENVATKGKTDEDKAVELLCYL